ncbi:MAG TPA: hybrid sensor histidine kinase/response regulator, partial [Planctomycetota bacterium]|nr:hybrid sensor histidine kinase/response regulator [Planctomycetota bacterium]
ERRLHLGGTMDGGESPAGSHSARETVLIVDDERRNRSLVAAYLAPIYRVLEAESGLQAIDVAARERVDLVLLDVVMPAMNGYDACRALKAQANGSFFPVILLTALSAQEDRNQGLAAGADDFLTKPVNKTELLLRCAAFLRLRRQEGQIRGPLDDLRRLTSLKDDLFALIIHDLRNPLTGIDGYLQILALQLSTSPDAQLRSDIERLLQSARKLRGLVDGILDVRLLEEGELKLRLEAINVAAMVSDAVETLAGAGEAMRVPIRRQVPPDLAVRADPKLARRAIENLLANALKYSPRQGEIVVSAVPASEGRIAIEVADRGPGVPDDLKGHLFQKFGSIEARRGHERRGYGLGLHLVKLVAGAHGGEVSIRDRDGGGSVFRLELPA